MKTPVILYAPNVHSGGGLVLLTSLICSWHGNQLLYAILDVRCQGELTPILGPNILVKYWVKPSIFSRLRAEIILYLLTRNNQTILCFHNLPPILSQSKNIFIFLQNRLILIPISQISFFSKLFLINILERLIIKLLGYKATYYIVQTESMKNLLFANLRRHNNLKILVLPFFEKITNDQKNVNEKIFDFIYISNSEKHKNHLTLLDSWALLAENGIKKTLALTIKAHEAKLEAKISDINSKHGKLIINFGNVSHADALDLYSKSNALIFPSKEESFGLPLLEATALNMPILAPELDYVRDVCEPAQTFNPNSALSISRAIKRYLDIESQNLRILSPNEFWKSIIDINLQSDLKTQSNTVPPSNLGCPQ